MPKRRLKLVTDGPIAVLLREVAIPLICGSSKKKGSRRSGSLLKCPHRLHGADLSELHHQVKLPTTTFCHSVSARSIVPASTAVMFGVAPPSPMASVTA